MTDIIYPPGAAPVDGVTTTLATVVQLTAETTRATGAETTLTTGLAAEATTARAAELTNATAITSETSRATAAEGALLPLAGGTLTGALAGTSFAFTGAGTVGGTLGVNPTAITWSGSTQTSAIGSIQTHTGTSSTNPRLNSIQLTDTVATSGNANGFNLIHNYGLGSGSRNALNVALVQQNGANTDTGADKFYVAATVQAFVRQTQPGSSTTTPLGRVFGLNAVGQIQAGFTATNLFQVAGAEFNVAISSGSSAAIRSGVTIADLGGTAQGYRADNMLWLYGSGAKWRYGINFSDSQVWPIDTSVGTMFGAKYGGGHNASDMAAMWGVDLQQVTIPATGNPYEGGAFRSENWSVDGAGTMQIGTTFLTPGASGLAIDAKGAVGTAAAIATAGSGYEAGTIVVAAYGGVWTVPIVAGVPTGTVTALVQPVISSTTPPSNPITPTNLNLASVGTGLTINITWNTTATTLALSPTGGATTVGGTLATAGNITATAGGGSISIQPNVTNGVIDAGAANLVIKSGTSGTGGLVNVFPTLQAPSLVLNKAAVTTGAVVGIKQGIALTGSSSTSPASVNLFSMSSDTVAATNGLNVINIAHQFGGSGLTGSRNSLAVTSTFTAQSGNASGSGYGPAQFTMTANAPDHGTATTAGNAHGNLFGFNTVAHFGASATNWAAICGYELDVYAESGSTVMDKIGEQIVLLNLDVVQGVRDDQALSFNNQYTQAAGTGWKTLIGVGRQGGFPGLDPTSGWILQCIPNLGVGSVAGAGGLDFTNFVPVTAFMQGNNFLLDPSGNFKANTFKVGSNQVVGARDTGWAAMTGSPDKASVYATGAVTLAQLAGRVAQLQASLTAHGLIGT